MLTGEAADRLALRYVERFATTRGRLADYLSRKLRERGWTGEAAPDPAAVAERMAGRGYVDDRGYAAMKGAALTRPARALIDQLMAMRAGGAGGGSAGNGGPAESGPAESGPAAEGALS